MTLTKTTNYMPITKVKKKNFAICMWRFMFGSCNLDWSIFQVISMLTYLLKCVTLSIYSNLKKKKSAPKNDFRNHHCVYYLKTYMVFIWQMVLVSGTDTRNRIFEHAWNQQKELDWLGFSSFFFCQILAIFDDFLMFLRYHF